MKEIEDAILASHVMNVRSPDRVKLIHTRLVQAIIKLASSFEYDAVLEQPVPCSYGDVFNVDVVIFKKGTVEIKVLILVKALVSSVGKNKFNNANTSIGEHFRVKGRNEYDNVLFITFCCRKTPIYNKGKLSKTWDKKPVVDLSKATVGHDYFDDAGFFTIWYDLDEIDYTTQQTFKDSISRDKIKNVNYGQFNRFVKKIFG